ncbi:hypothetical protein HMPREF0731_3166 [Pseudoroseomonas cervicalis ATCC 49957]|uniref:Uncharacterized protein n=1 Tax=Pseudoroseomonas cervicalis ATCC 49957 TaxID=525371 RepID=D5RQ04_9PROT|nr:hypothetical protein HMPREF0731_3166 [Pseudoroseomonas cervicalis ATCC 49957]
MQFQHPDGACLGNPQQNYDGLCFYIAAQFAPYFFNCINKFCYIIHARSLKFLCIIFKIENNLKNLELSGNSARQDKGASF